MHSVPMSHESHSSGAPWIVPQEENDNRWQSHRGKFGQRQSQNLGHVPNYFLSLCSSGKRVYGGKVESGVDGPRSLMCDHNQPKPPLPITNQDSSSRVLLHQSTTLFLGDMENKEKEDREDTC